MASSAIKLLYISTFFLFFSSNRILHFNIKSSLILASQWGLGEFNSAVAALITDSGTLKDKKKSY